ncbi:MAG TPA: hypothetical protein CFH79_03145 [Sulfurospirillum sp. UBA11407]|jgi:hypothetical protein|nr:MAG TPA: hypothetical protein CFH79_03145 [Sulfurospirillum sp. UBA11407]DAB35350.1 MAG TPA: hypothetical protein CFH82_00600 [Sulfurospirillum sp. UBA12182]
MKKIALSVILTSSLLLATDNTKKDCVETFQSEILNILNADKPKTEKEKAISDINKNMIEACDPLPPISEEKQEVKDEKAVEDCIEEFENDIMKILLSEPAPEEKKKAIKDVYKAYEEKCDGKF